MTYAAAVPIPPMPARLSYGAKVISAGVTFKALLMVSIVTTLGATTFGQSLVLVLVSAAATGIFGVVIVVVQANADKAIHSRLDSLEAQAVQVAHAATTAQAAVLEAVQAAEPPK